MTAAELMAKLQRDKEYQEKKRIQDLETEKQQQIYDADQAEMLRELNDIGYKLESVWDLVNRPNNYMSAVPILKDHLQREHHPKILSGIARALAIVELSDDDDLWTVLFELYESTPSDTNIPVPVDRGAQESIAAALRVLAKPTRVDSLKALLRKYPEGDGVAHFEKALERFESV